MIFTQLAMNSRLRVGLVITGVVLLFALILWFGFSLRPYSYHGTLLDSPKPVTDFTLSGPDGGPVKLSDYRGKSVVLYFGYTYCPDVCPTTMAELGQAMRTLGAKVDQVQVIMVTVDPERDTPDKLNKYVKAFDSRFVGLSGTPDQIASAATPLGVYYEKHPVSGAAGYLVDHTATTMVIDGDGRMRLVWPYGTAGEDMAADLMHLMK
jgi:protein SCO1